MMTQLECVVRSEEQVGDSARKLFRGIDVPNRVCFSPDDKTMYFADTPKRMIWAFDFDLDEGRISNQLMFADLTANRGTPGRVDRVIMTPVTKITCPGFVGPNRDVLYAATA